MLPSQRRRAAAAHSLAEQDFNATLAALAHCFGHTISESRPAGTRSGVSWAGAKSLALSKTVATGELCWRWPLIRGSTTGILHKCISVRRVKTRMYEGRGARLRATSSGYGPGIGLSLRYADWRFRPPKA